jgi:hypothetical protein
VLAAVTVMMMAALIMSGFAIGHGAVAHFRSSAAPQGSMAVSLIFVLYASADGMLRRTSLARWSNLNTDCRAR